MLVKYLLTGPICAVLSFIILLSLDVGGIPSAVLSWGVGSISLVVLAAANAYRVGKASNEYRARAHETRDSNLS